MSFISISARMENDKNSSLTVENDGITINERSTTRLFERFVQGSESQGSGLELAIVAQVAKMNKGVAELINTHPTQFRILLRNHS